MKIPFIGFFFLLKSCFWYQNDSSKYGVAMDFRVQDYMVQGGVKATVLKLFFACITASRSIFGYNILH
jgi:hypothetical protein